LWGLCLGSTDVASPREKGRALRAAGWKPSPGGWRLSWADPLEPGGGAHFSTKAAYAILEARLAKLDEKNGEK